MMEDKKIKEIYDVKPILGVNDSLAEWHNRVIEKTPDEVTLLDINRMVRQKRFIEVALNRGIEELKRNPYVGELCNGDILEHMLRVDSSLLLKYKDDLKYIIKQAESNMNGVAWWYPEEKDEYIELLAKLKKIIK